MNYNTISDLVEGEAAKRPDDVFLLSVEEGTRYTYAEVDDRTDAVAGALQDRGVEQGDVVGAALSNSLEYALLMLAGAKLGVTVASIEPEYTEELVQYAVDVTDATVVCFDETTRSTVETLDDGSIDFFVGFGGEDGTADTVPFASLSGSGAEVTGVSPSFSTPYHISFSSGTTGDPKPLLLSQHFWVSLGDAIARNLETNAADRYFANLTMAHGNPYLGIFAALNTGASVAIGAEFSASTYWDEVRSVGATALITHLKPTDILLERATEADKNNPAEAAAFLTGPQAGPFLETFDIERGITGYGSMEAGGLCSINPVTRAKASEITENMVGADREEFTVAVVDEDDTLLPPGEPGEIVVRPEAPHVMFERYYGMSDRTLEALGNLWYHTGDIGYKNEDGELYFIGREDDAIRVQGRYVPITRIEAVVAGVEGVIECAIVGVPSERGDEELKAYVTTHPDVDVTPSEIVDHCHRELADVNVPRYVEFIDEFPRSEALMKIQRNQLSEWGVRGAWDRRAEQ